MRLEDFHGMSPHSPVRVRNLRRYGDSISPEDHQSVRVNKTQININNDDFLSIWHRIEAKIAEENVLKNVYVSVKERFLSRVELQEEYLAAAVLDPAQSHSEYLSTYLTEARTNRFNVIKKVAEKYGIQTQQPDQSPSVADQHAEVSALI